MKRPKKIDDAIDSTTVDNNILISSDVIQYYQYSADFGDFNSKVIIGQLYYYGLNGVKRNLQKSFSILSEAVKEIPSLEPEENEEEDLANDVEASSNQNLINNMTKGIALSLLGMMYLLGEGAPSPDSEFALALLKRACLKTYNAPLGHHGVGLYHYLISKDYESAFKSFSIAASKEYGSFPESHYMIARMLVRNEISHSSSSSSYETILQHLRAAAEHGHLLALFEFGRYFRWKNPVISIFQNAAPELSLKVIPYFKAIAERSAEVYDLFEIAEKNERSEDSLFIYYLLAELGCEAAQVNAAVLLQEGTTIVSFILLS